MKQLFRHIISISSAIYFLFAGLGFNIVNYCCDNCENKGIEYIAQNSCSDIHDNDHEEDCCNDNHEDIACSDLHHHPKSCHLLHVKVETPTFVSVTQILAQNFFKIQMFSVVNFLNENINYTSHFHSYPPPYDVSQFTGREILCLNSVLLI